MNSSSLSWLDPWAGGNGTPHPSAPDLLKSRGAPVAPTRIKDSSPALWPLVADRHLPRQSGAWQGPPYVGKDSRGDVDEAGAGCLLQNCRRGARRAQQPRREAQAALTPGGAAARRRGKPSRGSQSPFPTSTPPALFLRRSGSLRRPPAYLLAGRRGSRGHLSDGARPRANRLPGRPRAWPGARRGPEEASRSGLRDFSRSAPRRLMCFLQVPPSPSPSGTSPSAEGPG